MSTTPYDHLFDLAFRLKKAKPWKQLSDTQMFAARTDRGDLLFICVMGRIGEHYAVAVYNEEEFQHFYRVFDAMANKDALQTTDGFELMISMSCLQCSLESKDALSKEELELARAYAKAHGIRFAGANAYPRFVEYSPYRFPWQITDPVKIEHLTAGLEATLALAEILKKDPSFSDKLPLIGDGDEKVSEVVMFCRTGQGWEPAGMAAIPQRKEEAFPEGSAGDPEVTASIRIKRKRGTIGCRVFWFTQPFQDAPDEVPYFACFMLAADESDGTVLSVEVVRNYASEYETLLSSFLAALKERKTKPSKVCAQDERTYRLLKKAMEAASIPPIKKAELPALYEAAEDFLDHFSRPFSDDFDDEYFDDEDFDDEDIDFDDVDFGDLDLDDEDFDDEDFDGDAFDDEAFAEMEREMEQTLSEMEAMDDKALSCLPPEFKDMLLLISITEEDSSPLKKRADSMLRRLNALHKANKNSAKILPFKKRRK